MKIHHFDGIYQERWGFSWAMLVSGRVNHVTDKTTSTKRWVLLPLTSKGLSLGTLANAVDRPPISLRRHEKSPKVETCFMVLRLGIMFWALIWVKHFCKLTNMFAGGTLLVVGMGFWNVQLPIPVVCLHGQTGRATFLACCVHTTDERQIPKQRSTTFASIVWSCSKRWVWVGRGWRGLVVIGGTWMNLDEVRLMMQKKITPEISWDHLRLFCSRRPSEEEMHQWKRFLWLPLAPSMWKFAAGYLNRFRWLRKDLDLQKGFIWFSFTKLNMSPKERNHFKGPFHLSTMNFQGMC